MPISIGDIAQSGTCLDDVHNRRYNDHIDSISDRVEVIETARADEPPGTIAASRYSELGAVNGGDTVAAGSLLPAFGGRVIPLPGAILWIRISGTAAVAGDGVIVTYEGRRTSQPTNPALRLISAAGTGAPGTDALPIGTIEIALSGVNSDNNYVHWQLQRKGA